MTIPTYEMIMLPLLKVLSDKKEHSISEVIEEISESFGLNEKEKKEVPKSGGEPIIRTRVRWARLYLENARLLETISKDSYRITEKGLRVLQEEPSKIDEYFLKRFPEFEKFVSPKMWKPKKCSKCGREAKGAKMGVSLSWICPECIKKHKLLTCPDCGKEFPYSDYLPVGDFFSVALGKVWYFCEECIKKKIALGEIAKSETEVLGIIRLENQLLYFEPSRVIMAYCRKRHWKYPIYVHDKRKERELLEWGLTKDEEFVIPYSEITEIGLKKRWFFRSFVELEVISDKKLPIGVEMLTTKLQNGSYYHRGFPRGLLFSIEGQYIIEKKKPKIEDYKNLLGPIFGDKLSDELYVGAKAKYECGNCKYYLMPECPRQYDRDNKVHREQAPCRKFL